MTDVMTAQQRSRCMSRIRGKNTKPELAVRRGLWRLGYRYRLQLKVPGHPDIVFPKEKIAIFIDGCFWHRCPEHYNRPATNTSTWDEKISRNVIRDQSVNKLLTANNWLVLRFWEHEVISNLDAVIRKIAGQVDSARQRK